MKKEIENFTDVQLLVRSFYSKVLKDEKLGPYFAYVAANHWDKHLETLDSFWNNLLFFSGGYEGNPIQVHKTLHHFKQLDKAAFDRWIQLFLQTVDDLFVGEKAELARQRAYSIATMMQLKILHPEVSQLHMPVKSGKQGGE